MDFRQRTKIPMFEPAVVTMRFRVERFDVRTDEPLECASVHMQNM